MNKQFNDLENEMINFDFDSLKPDIQSTKQALSANAAVGDTKLCEIWKKIGRFIKPLTALPIVGKYIAVFIEIMDSICPQ